MIEQFVQINLSLMENAKKFHSSPQKITKTICLKFKLFILELSILFIVICHSYQKVFASSVVKFSV